MFWSGPLALNHYGSDFPHGKVAGLVYPATGGHACFEYAGTPGYTVGAGWRGLGVGAVALVQRCLRYCPRRPVSISIRGRYLRRRRRPLHRSPADAPRPRRRGDRIAPLLHLLAAGYDAVDGSSTGCASSHHWSRALQGLGHRVRLMPPAYVKPYVKRQKSAPNFIC